MHEAKHTKVIEASVIDTHPVRSQRGAECLVHDARFNELAQLRNHRFLANIHTKQFIEQFHGSLHGAGDGLYDGREGWRDERGDV